MTAIYEPIMNALLAFLQATCLSTHGGPFITIQRRFITWENLLQSIQVGNSPLLQPAMIVYGGVGFGGGGTNYDPRGRGTPGVRTLTRTLVIYAQAVGAGTPGGPIDATTPGDSVFAPLVESVESAFDTATDSEGAVTLGRTVSHCWIEGESWWMTPDIDPGGQGMLTIPVKIMIP